MLSTETAPNRNPSTGRREERRCADNWRGLASEARLVHTATLALSDNYPVTTPAGCGLPHLKHPTAHPYFRRGNTLMSRKIRWRAALSLAVLSAAVPGAAHAAAITHVPVPAGQLQHTVTELSWPVSTNA